MHATEAQLRKAIKKHLGEKVYLERSIQSGLRSEADYPARHRALGELRSASRTKDQKLIVSAMAKYVEAGDALEDTGSEAGVRKARRYAEHARRILSGLHEHDECVKCDESSLDAKIARIARGQ